MQNNTPTVLAILIAMGMWQYNAGRIARWSTSRASLEANGCHHRAGAWDVSPRQLLWSMISNETQKHQQTQFLASNYHIFFATE